MILGFMDQFLPMVLDGSKQHSIRAGNRWKAGMRADLFARPRQPEMLLLFRAPVRAVETIEICKSRGAYCGHAVRIEKTLLSEEECDSLAWADGFRSRCSPCKLCKNWGACQLRGTCREAEQQSESLVAKKYSRNRGCFETMMRFWSGRLPFAGQIVFWNYASRRNVATPHRLIEFCKTAFGKRMSIAVVESCVPEAVRAFGLEKYIQSEIGKMPISTLFPLSVPPQKTLDSHHEKA